LSSEFSILKNVLKRKNNEKKPESLKVYGILKCEIKLDLTKFTSGFSSGSLQRCGPDGSVVIFFSLIAIDKNGNLLKQSFIKIYRKLVE
jgi:hypothetical protein